VPAPRCTAVTGMPGGRTTVWLGGRGARGAVTDVTDVTAPRLARPRGEPRARALARSGRGARVRAFYVVVMLRGGCVARRVARRCGGGAVVRRWRAVLAARWRRAGGARAACRLAAGWTFPCSWHARGAVTDVTEVTDVTAEHGRGSSRAVPCVTDVTDVTDVTGGSWAVGACGCGGMLTGRRWAALRGGPCLSWCRVRRARPSSSPCGARAVRVWTLVFAGLVSGDLLRDGRASATGGAAGVWGHLCALWCDCSRVR